MGSNISDDQFIGHILKNLISNYEMQLPLMESCVGDKDKPLTVEEIRAEMSLCFEILNMKSTNDDDREVMEDQALFSGQFKGKCRNCSQMVHKSYQCKNRGNHNGRNSGNTNAKMYCTYCHKTGKSKRK